MMVLTLLGNAFIVLCGWVLLHSYIEDPAETPSEDAALGALVMCFGVLGAGASIWAIMGGAA